MTGQLSPRPGFWPMLKFALPTICMMLLMSVYAIADGIFVSRWVGTDALAAVNIISPFLFTSLVLGSMFGAGGSAVIARKIGEGNEQEAKEDFSFILCITVCCGVIISVLAALFQNNLLHVLGGSAKILPYCRAYLGAVLPFIPFGLLQLFFQFLFVTAGKPQVGMAVAIVAGGIKIALNYFLIVQNGWGVMGAAVSTGIGYAIPSVFAVLYFWLKRNGLLCIVRPKRNRNVIFKCVTNGASEMVGMVAGSIAVYVFNILMMRHIGEEGVAAVGIILYSQSLLTAVYIGFSSGVAPLISHTLGAGDWARMKKQFLYCLRFILICSAATYVLTLFTAEEFTAFFAQPGSTVFQLTVYGFRLFSISYIFTGVNLFSSSFFTALSNGRVSAIISFLRTLVFLVSMLIILPFLFGINGIWLAVPVAEILTFPVSVYFIQKYKDRYHYA